MKDLTLQDAYKRKLSKRDYRPSIEYGIKAKFDMYAENELQQKKINELLNNKKYLRDKI